MLGSVAHASLSGCCVAAVKRHGKHPTECAVVGSRQSRYRGARLNDCSEGPSTSSSPSIRSFTTFPVTHKRCNRVECSASKEDLASSASKRTPPPPPLSTLGADLAEVLESQPEQFEELIEEKLDLLVLEREVDRIDYHHQQPTTNALSDEAVLKRRIAEVRETERSRVIQDIMHSSILSQMSDFNVTPISGCEEGDLKWLRSTRSSEELQALVDMHSSLLLDLVKRHVADTTNGFRELSRTEPASLPMLGVSKVYRRSLLFGYSLQQGTERYSLEKAVCTIHNHSAEPESLAQYLHRALAPQWFKHQRADEQQVGKEASLNLAGNTLVEMRPRTRAAGFLTPQAAATAERHADALFGDVEAMTSAARPLLLSARSPEEAHVRMMLAAKAGQVDVVSLTLGGVCHLLMQAVTFGRLLRQVECQVDLNYNLEFHKDP